MNHSLDPSSAALLDYAPKPRRSRKIIRRAAGLVVVLGLAIAIYRVGPAVRDRATLLYHQRRSMNYTAPADQIVYEQSPTDVKALLSDGGYTNDPMAALFGSKTPPAPSAAFKTLPDCWHDLIQLEPIWMSYQGCNPLPTECPYDGTVMFLHALAARPGHERLVCVRYVPGDRPFRPDWLVGYNYQIDVFLPAGVRSGPSRVWQAPTVKLWHDIPRLPKPPPELKIFAGQIDPNDLSHFTIRYEMWGKEDTLDGRLGTNDRVTLKARHLPIAPAATTADWRTMQEQVR